MSQISKRTEKSLTQIFFEKANISEGNTEDTPPSEDFGEKQGGYLYRLGFSK